MSVDDVLDLNRHHNENPEDIFSLFLPMLYDYEPITHADAGAIFTYRRKSSEMQEATSFTIKLEVPDTLAKNNGLHASSIWSSALYLADNIDDHLRLAQWTKERIALGKSCEVLELGAGAGLPGITLAKSLENVSGDWRVTLSDYPDDNIVSTLRKNVVRNGLSKDRCMVSPYNWGTDASSLIAPTARADGALGFDLIIAADTLWNSDFHAHFLCTLETLLRRDADSRIHLIAGFHTGRFMIQRFLDAASSRSLEVVHVEERTVSSTLSSANDKEVRSKAWDLHREDYDPKERRKWVVWIVLRWSRQDAK
ncbi:hypothetical protein SCHPADRAFT_494122 [Schizopora paradoxa]|uniref:Nicotinamide N-methyltransferase n=1 Tax=Schizopora paradoxa TaxID=27342 RepID=A0A0H2RNG2_9AGAM|nr:hypothetical protein SCHPADRAFT_494122 [Schizopora paradoxa]